MNHRSLFYLFGILQAVTLGLIIYFVLQTTQIGPDTAIMLSVLFPLFTWIIELLIYGAMDNTS
jgi:hypothetical protein